MKDAHDKSEGIHESNSEQNSENKEGHLMQDTSLRYVGYSAVAARAFRYLAFTSGQCDGIIRARYISFRTSNTIYLRIFVCI